MPQSTGDEGARRQREAVEREMRRRGDGGDGDLVDTVGEEQRRERARDEDETDDEEDQARRDLTM